MWDFQSCNFVGIIKSESNDNQRRTTSSEQRKTSGFTIVSISIPATRSIVSSSFISEAHKKETKIMSSHGLADTSQHQATTSTHCASDEEQSPVQVAKPKSNWAFRLSTRTNSDYKWKDHDNGATIVVGALEIQSEPVMNYKCELKKSFVLGQEDLFDNAFFTYPIRTNMWSNSTIHILLWITSWRWRYDQEYVTSVEWVGISNQWRMLQRYWI